MQTTKEDVHPRAATALAAVRALRISLNEWMFAHWQLRDSARNTVIADFERMLGELDAVWPLLTPNHGPALVIHRLLTKHLETRFAPPGHPAGRDIVMPILAGKVGPRFTEREERTLGMAFKFVEGELLKLAGEPAAVPEQTRELPAVNAEVDAPVAAGSGKPGAMVESKGDGRELDEQSAGQRRSVGMSLEQYGEALNMDPRTFKRKATVEWDLKPDGRHRWTVRLDLMAPSDAERVERHAANLVVQRRARKKLHAAK